VIDAIKGTWSNKRFVSGNTLEGTANGMTITMFVQNAKTFTEKIISAFPK
jgi:hypothetical protein